MGSDGSLLSVFGPPDPIRVLLADDEPGLRTALTELLSHEERVELIGTAADAEEAIRIAGTDHPDVALVDVRMPEGGGPAAARGISRVSPRTRVIALSRRARRCIAISNRFSRLFRSYRCRWQWWWVRQSNSTQTSAIKRQAIC